jgi:hypothetical protein
MENQEIKPVENTNQEIIPPANLQFEIELDIDLSNPATAPSKKPWNI